MDFHICPGHFLSAFGVNYIHKNRLMEPGGFRTVCTDVKASACVCLWSSMYLNAVSAVGSL